MRPLIQIKLSAVAVFCVMVMVNSSPSCPLTDPTGGHHLIRAATQYPIFWGHIASFFVQSATIMVKY